MFADSSRPSSSRFSYCAMKTGVKAMLVKPWFVGATTLALFHQLLQKVWNLNLSLIDSYLDPLLFMPILLHLILLERRYLFGKGSAYVFSWTQILTIIALIAVLCEYFFPRWNASFTADYIDVLCYLLGGILFGVLFNRPVKA